ncbi:MAG TPA: hypothetical protein PLX89_12170 [Verrucomicrobiota bacterium]|nr:hypothetical protein [Verrucomicrobiota bacterium]
MNDPDAGSPSPTPFLRSADFRVIHPFEFDSKVQGSPASAFAGITAALLSAQMDGVAMWEAPGLRNPAVAGAPVVPELYYEELLPAVRRFLFGGKSDGTVYIRLSRPLVTTVFRNGLDVWLSEGKDGRVVGPPSGPPSARLLPEAAVELFLLSSGIGVLSVQIGIEANARNPLSLDRVQELNYRLAQRRHKECPIFAIPHPRLSGRLVGSQLEDAVAKAGEPPRADLPLEQRLGRPGGLFTLEEWKDVLLSPLESEAQLRDAQGQFSLYSVVTFGHQTSWETSETRAPLAHFLSGMAQAEEEDHAGSLPREISVPNELLNSRHWAAAGSLAAAHLICDQWPTDGRGHPQRYDGLRGPTVLHRYFILWLLAQLQRLHFLRSVNDVAAVAQASMSSSSTPQAQGIRELRVRLLEFQAKAYQHEVSVRAVHNRYYRLAQQGLQIEPLFDRVHHAVENLDSVLESRGQTEIALGQSTLLGEIRRLTAEQEQSSRSLVDISKEVKANVETIQKIQTKIEYVEIFLVAVYAVELIAHLGHAFGFNNDYVGWSILVGSTVAAALAAWRLLSGQPHLPRGRTVLLVLIPIVLLLALYLISGWVWARHGKRDVAATSPPAAAESNSQHP